jgi:hypothetical protein
MIVVFVDLSRVLVFSFAWLMKIRVLADFTMYSLAASIIVVFTLASM